MTRRNVTVAVRLRPLTAREVARHERACVQKHENEFRVLGTTKNANGEFKTRAFRFDHTFSSMHHGRAACEEQEEIFEALGRPLVAHALAGYNATIFAYGQTGSGKSYTMTGPPGEARGISPRLVEALFAALDSEAPYQTSVEVSYLEVYNEKIRDLLNAGPKQTLRLRENQAVGFYVENLKRFPAPTARHALDFFHNGNMLRALAATNMNLVSSRSHAVFIIYVTLTARGGAQAMTTSSTINLVDLAGSERQRKTSSEGAHLEEACYINKSLFALGNVISALSDTAGRRFVPYRNSTLTLLLKNSLGGNSHTVMVATVSPAQGNADETLSTLKFAARAKRIQNRARKNERPSDEQLIHKLERQIQLLKARLARKEHESNALLEVERKSIETELAAAQHLIQDLSHSKERLLREAELHRRMFQNAFSSLGVDIEKLRAFAEGAAELPPCLVNVLPEAELSGSLVFFLRTPTRRDEAGVSVIGSGAAATVVVGGVGVKQRHACVSLEYTAPPGEDGAQEAQGSSRSEDPSDAPPAPRELRAVIAPEGEHCRLFVNGRRVLDAQELRPNDMITIGHHVDLCFCVGAFPASFADVAERGARPRSALPGMCDLGINTASEQYAGVRGPFRLQDAFCDEGFDARTVWCTSEDVVLPFQSLGPQLERLAFANALALEATEICQELCKPIRFALRVATEGARLEGSMLGDPEVVVVFAALQLTQVWSVDTLADRVELMRPAYSLMQRAPGAADTGRAAACEFLTGEFLVDDSAFLPVAAQVLLAAVRIAIPDAPDTSAKHSFSEAVRPSTRVARGRRAPLPGEPGAPPASDASVFLGAARRTLEGKVCLAQNKDGTVEVQLIVQALRGSLPRDFCFSVQFLGQTVGTSPWFRAGTEMLEQIFVIGSGAADLKLAPNDLHVSFFAKVGDSSAPKFEPPSPPARSPCGACSLL